MIQCDDVTKTYPGGFEALSHVQFHLEKGELAFLTGPSGAGKSTLLRLLAAMERTTWGKVVIDGQDLSRLGTRHIPALRRKIGFVFQNPRLLNDRTVYDNVALPLLIAGHRPQEIGSRVRAALDTVGLLSKEKSSPLTLSGGEQQRVGIARAVVTRPPVLLADEPTGNLDPELSREIMNLFIQLIQMGTTALIASHDHDLVQHLRRRVITLRDGQLVDDHHV
ncbi:MAG: cell division ATP-binding protein FtsE [Gammaproteobacteria bacterium]|nr:cell division ATP-binding protein FtsE [Gammaproteobacteria bacterium]